MEYNKVKISDIKLVGKTFSFPTEKISETNYSEYYMQTCKGMNPTISYGIYEIGEVETKFTVAIDTSVENDYEEVALIDGEYYEFTINMMDNQKEDQYTKCINQLLEAGIDVDMSYSFEMMDRSFCPELGQFDFKFYLKAK